VTPADKATSPGTPDASATRDTPATRDTRDTRDAPRTHDASDGWLPVALSADLPEGSLLAVTAADGADVCLMRSSGEVFALLDCCTHERYPLSAGEVEADGTIVCVWHGARFDLRTGAARSGPATEPVATYAVAIDGDRILLGPRRP